MMATGFARWGFPKESFGVGFAIGLLLAGGLATGSPDVRADPRVRLTITVIHAKKTPPFLHERLKPMWETLRRTFGDRFAHYNLLSTTEKEVTKGDRVEAPTPEGGQFAVTYRGVSEDGRFVKLDIQQGALSSRVRLHNGGLVFQAGKRHEGGVLVVGVQAAVVKP